MLTPRGGRSLAGRRRKMMGGEGKRKGEEGTGRGRGLAPLSHAAAQEDPCFLEGTPRASSSSSSSSRRVNRRDGTFSSRDKSRGSQESTI